MLFGFSLREIVSNIIGSLVADALTPGGMTAYAITLAMVVWAAISWHRRQRAAKKLGMASWQFIALCCVVAAIAIACGAYGLGLRGEGKGEQEKIDALNDALAAKDRQLKEARENQAAPPPPARVVVNGAPLGPMTALHMREGLNRKARKGGLWSGDPGPSPIDLRWAVVFTAPNENRWVAEFLYQLMMMAELRVLRLEVPDPSANLDAPKFPKPEREGITLHGENILNTRLLGVLRPCLNVHFTKQTIDGLREWYHDQLVPEQTVVWIEIGNGSPWTMQAGCFS